MNSDDAQPHPGRSDASAGEQHVRVDALRKDLKGQSVRSGAITMGAQVLQLVAGVGSMMVLARLLTPQAFGLFAMSDMVISLLKNVKDGGLSAATVHREDVTHRQVSALFWLNVKLQGTIALLATLLAPVLVWFYDEARLLTMTLVMAGGLFVLGLTVIHTALLKRQMRFGAVKAVQIGATLAGAAAGISAALLGAGYWALVLQFVAYAFAQSGLAWLLCQWRPASYMGLPEALSTGVHSMLSYGAYLTGARVLERLVRSSDRLVIGYVAGARPLGLYDNAYKWSLFPVIQIQLPLFNVIVSTLSRVQDDPARYRAYCRVGLLPLFALPLPALAFIFVDAHDVVLLLLGEQWLAAVPFFRLLCVAASFESIRRITKMLYLSQGQTDRQLRWELAEAPIFLGAVVGGSYWGAMGVAIGWTMATGLTTVPRIAFCLRQIPLRMLDLVRIVWRPALAALAAAAVLFAARPALPTSGLLLIDVLLHASVLGSVYLMLWMFLPGGWQATADVLKVVRMVWPNNPFTS